MSDKIKPQHLQRKAILYVRQSSGYQVVNNLESQRLQYAMQDRLRELGWQEIDVIDDDLGRSASEGHTRSGFERMVAAVCMGHVGAVCAREASRFARNSRDWQQLVEVCRVVDTLLIDHEGVYSPRQGNDRLLLGLKGTLNEYEIDVLRQRANEARLQKARRGELVSHCPVGFIKGVEAVLEKDPDQRVVSVIQLVFDKFLELGSVRQTLLWFLENGIAVPRRTTEGDVQWKMASYAWMHRLLTHPAYGGTYAYGRTVNDTCYEAGVPRQRTRRRPQEQWIALIPGAHTGYVSWETSQRITSMIASNALTSGQASTASMPGAALLSGLLRCRRCGRMLRTFYKGDDGKSVRYACPRAGLDTREARCIAFSGVSIEAAISSQILTVVQPGAIAAAESACQQQMQEHEQVLEVLRREFEAAQYRAQHAQRQYDAADPQNRHVAAELERRWEQALQEVRTLEDRIETHVQQVQHVGEVTIQDFESLAKDLESVWNDPLADARTKKRILRALIQELVVDIDAQTNEIVVILHWKGGVHSTLRVPRRRRGQNSVQTSKDVVEAVRILARVSTDQQIAGFLNRDGMLTGRGNYWTRALVASLRSKHAIMCFTPERQRAEGWLNLSAAAAAMGTTNRTVRLAIERGEIKALRPLAHGPWVLNVSDLPAGKLTRPANASNSGAGTPAVPGAEQLPLDLSRT
jgi:DNA invertase Pin-like site-specific DNA recombinase